MTSRLHALVAGVRRSDVVVTAVLLVLSVAQALVVPFLDRPLAVLYAVVSVTPLAWRRVHPEIAALVGTSMFLVPTTGYLVLGFVVVIVLFFSLGLYGRGGVVGALVCAWAAMTGTIGTLLGPENDIAGVLSAWIVPIAPYLFGRLMARQQDQAEQRVREERERARREAVADERARIVRELHDVVGHEVTLMTIQSEAAALAMQRAPERAAEPIRAIRETAHRASRELRAILDLLGGGELPVAPDGRGLDELVDRANRLGIPCTLTVSGTPWGDAPRHWLAVNRIVQECLTNAGKHAPGTKADVEVAWTPADVTVTVSNPAPDVPWRAGRGLDGMAERARSLGGTFAATVDDGVFVARAVLPGPEVSS